MDDKIIILADDDSDDRFFIQQAILSSGIDVTVIEAENGLELINILNSTQLKISLIIIDMNMPKMNGLEAMLQIRSMPVASVVPVVMISTSPNQDLAERAYQAGVKGFMSKPNTFDEFNKLVLTLHERFLT